MAGVVAEVAGADVAALHQDLAVVGDAHPHPRDRQADGADPVVVGRVARGRATRLGLAVELDEGEPDRVEPADQVGVDRRGRGDQDVGLVEAELVADLGADHPVEHLVGQPLPQRRATDGASWASIRAPTQPEVLFDEELLQRRAPRPAWRGRLPGTSPTPEARRRTPSGGSRGDPRRRWQGCERTRSRRRRRSGRSRSSSARRCGSAGGTTRAARPRGSGTATRSCGSST